MAITAYPGNLQTAQTGNADSTNTIQMKGGETNLRAFILRIVSTIGATPTVTVNVKGSPDNSTWSNVWYSPMAAIAGDWTNAALTITTAVTALYQIMPGQGYNYLKIVMSANTNVTLTSDLL